MGGAAGSLKSETLLMDAVQEFRNPNLRAIIFRESYPNLTDLIRKAHRLYPRYPYFGKYNSQDKTWSFPTNARELADRANVEAVALGQIEPVYVAGRTAQVIFRYLIRDEDVYDHQGQEYSFIGVDESTHQTEFRIQYLLTRLRSTDPSLRLRMRLGTNPGGEGHTFHMKVFVGSLCPHCHPGDPKARTPYRIYKDACWSDGQPLSQIIDGVEVVYTTQFIPGNLTDHALFGNGNVKYRAQLRMQRPATAKALEEGCWAMFEGQYFDVWEENRGVTRDEVGNIIIPKPDMRMVVNRAEVETQYWWPHFTGTDYGFTNSWTASYLCVRTPADDFFPNGRIYVLQEYCEPRKLAEDVAEELLRRWFLFEKQPSQWAVPDNPLAIQMWALSHDAFNETGLGDNGVSITRADQMNGKLAKYGMGFVRAANERPGGWQHIYRMLRSGELVICGDTCPVLVEAIPSRIKDPKKPDDIFKQEAEKLDDAVDAIRYATYSWFKVGGKPPQIELAERIQGLSPTDAMITKAKFRDEQARKDTPVFVGRDAQRRQRLWEQARMASRSKS